MAKRQLLTIDTFNALLICSKERKFECDIWGILVGLIWLVCCLHRKLIRSWIAEKILHSSHTLLSVAHWRLSHKQVMGKGFAARQRGKRFLLGLHFRLQQPSENRKSQSEGRPLRGSLQTNRRGQARRKQEVLMRRGWRELCNAKLCVCVCLVALFTFALHFSKRKSVCQTI